MWVEEYLSAFRKRPIAGLCASLGLIALASAIAFETQGGLPLLTFVPVVLFSAFFGGWQIGLPTLLLSAVLGWYFFLQPEYSFALPDPAALALAVFIIVSILIITVVDFLSQALRKLSHERTQIQLEREALRNHEDEFKFLLRGLSRRTRSHASHLAALIRRLGPPNERTGLQEKLERYFGDLTDGLDLVFDKPGETTLHQLTEHYICTLCDRARCEIRGPEIRLRSQAARYLSLAIRELAMNATAHGALSVESGKILIWWEADWDRDLLNIEWKETGGPPPACLKKVGFGSGVLQSVVPAGIKGRAELRFPPDGAIWTLNAPLTRVM